MKTPVHSRGFTLLEILIVVVILGIIAAIAYPSYTSAIAKSRRGQAVACLQDHAQFAERYYTTNLTYVGLPSGTNPFGLTCTTDKGLNNYYSFSVSNVAARAYTVSTTATSAQQSSDPEHCSTMSINQTGARSVSGGGSLNTCF